MNVLIIVPPFGPVEYPVLGPSLLKPAVRATGAECSILYANLEFARRIGFDSYISTYYADPPLLLADRVFSRALFGSSAPPLEAYWSEVALPFAAGMMSQVGPAALLEQRFRAVQAAEREAVRLVDEVAAWPAVSESDVIGLSSTFGQHAAALALADRIKRRYPEKPVILGGANCEGAMGLETLRSFPRLDYVSDGPAEVSFPEFVRQLAGGREPVVAGIRGRRSAGRTAAPREAPLDSLPYPDYDDFFAAYDRMPEERWRIRSIPVEGSRGCWWGEKHHCIFCGINGERMAFRRKSGSRFAAEIDFLVEKYGMPCVWATDNILDMAYFDDLLPLLRETRRYDELFFEVKANLRKDHLLALVAAGVTRLQPGIESLDTSILRLMRKGSTALQNLQLLKWAAELNLTLQWNIICGFPGEDPEAYARMCALVKRIPHLPPPKACSQITIDRFSPLFRDPAGFGIRIAPATSYRHVYPLEPAAIENIAYFHSQRSNAVDTSRSLAVPAYASALFQQIKIWQGLAGRVALAYESLGDGTVEVRDTRPGSSARSRRLDGLEADLLLYADEIGTVAQLRDRVGRSGRGSAGGAAVQRALERLCAWGYLHRDEGKYLSLAIAEPNTARRARNPSSTRPAAPAAP